MKLEKQVFLLSITQFFCESVILCIFHLQPLMAEYCMFILFYVISLLYLDTIILCVTTTDIIKIVEKKVIYCALRGHYKR